MEEAKEGVEAQGEKGKQKEGERVRLHATVEALRPTLLPRALMAQSPPGGVGMVKFCLAE